MSVTGIQWKKSDYVRLGQAIAKFNKTIREHQSLENKLDLPEEITYQEIKENIYTRQGLNKMLSLLKRITNKNAFDVIELEGGQNIIRWEYNQLKNARQNYINYADAIIEKLNTPQPGQKYSRIQMGSAKYHQLESTIESLNNLESLTGSEFVRIANRITSLGHPDYQYKKASVYRDNFMFELYQLLRNNPEFEKVYEFFDKIKNPIKFFETTQKSQALQDFFTWYQAPLNYAGFTTMEELTENILNSYKEVNNM